MNRSDFQTLSEIREKEAKALLDAGCYPGAYYLAGYSVECAFKSTICKETLEFDFPDKAFASKAHTHHLETLMTLAGLLDIFQKEVKVNAQLEVNWALVKDWSEGKRYSLGISQSEAEDLLIAISEKVDGVLTWIRRYC